MPLTSSERRFVEAIDRLKIYLLGLSVAIFLFLLCTPPSESHLVIAMLGIALCGMFWLTQRLLALISLLDRELTKAIDALKQAISDDSSRTP